jgi:catechol 2,3-dioxygenase-like lactoylglutathione lyase family enzyme
MALTTTQRIVVFDTADPAASSTFWQALLGGTVDTETDWHTLVVDGVPTVAFQLAPDHVRPDWPDGAPQQIHMDLYVPDVEPAHAEVMAAGAEHLRSEDDRHFRVYADPAGHPFCLCWD